MVQGYSNDTDYRELCKLYVGIYKLESFNRLDNSKLHRE